MVQPRKEERVRSESWTEWMPSLSLPEEELWEVAKLMDCGLPRGARVLPGGPGGALRLG